jgi:hypothetical protein
METNGKSMVISGMLLQQRGISPPQKKSSHINIDKTNMIACLSIIKFSLRCEANRGRQLVLLGLSLSRPLALEPGIRNK